MKANTFGEHLRHFVKAVDHVTESTFRDVLRLTATYAHQELGLNYLEFMTPQQVNGRDGLVSFDNFLNGRSNQFRYSTELYEFDENGSTRPRSQSALAYIERSPLWLISRTKKPLNDCDDIDDHWSHKQDLPRYKQPQGLLARTSVIVPVSRGTDCLGILDFEGMTCIPQSMIITKELSEIADCVAQLWFLYQALEVQNMGTAEALDYLNDILASRELPYLGKSKLFLAYPGRYKKDTLAIINDTLQAFSDQVEVVDWGKLDKPGDITLELFRQIGRCRFGLCYFSEETEEGSNYFQDNPNVLFEAGMMHALTSQPDGPQRNWIPIREVRSAPTPFDISSLRTVLVDRDDEGVIPADAREHIAIKLRSILTNLLEISLSGTTPG